MKENKLNYRPIVLVIMDGWGIAPDSPGNGITRSKTPVFDRLVTSYPATSVVSYGDAVGLRWGEMGNSEVGHLNIGAGMVIYQNLPRLNREISSGDFFKNDVLLKSIEHVKKTKGKWHVMGLLSSGGVHSHIDHLFALLELAKKEKVGKVYLHAILDGRDAIYNSGKIFLKDIRNKAKDLDVDLSIATISGRFYSMDRDNRWDRTGAAYSAMVYGKGVENTEEDPIEYVESSYKKEVYDEQMPPTVFLSAGKPLATVEDGDSLLFYNFRSDRARQITKSFVVPHFDKFEGHKDFKDLFFVTMTEYEKDLPVEVAYPPIIIKTPLSKVFSDAGFTQFHLAETEKYAHVTFFINGGNEEELPGEERKVIPSPKVASYAEKPEMSAEKITDELLKQLQKDKYDFYVINFANPDMVAHTGDLKATIKAVEFVDKQLGKISEAVLAKNGLMVITADHGNAEEVLNLQTQDIDKEHSTNPVPLIIVAKDLEGQNLGLPEGVGSDLSLIQPTGILADVAPTIIKLAGLKQPSDMTGSSLI